MLHRSLMVSIVVFAGSTRPHAGRSAMNGRALSHSISVRAQEWLPDADVSGLPRSLA